jgi:beta-1,2-mannobiose phosphorylase / 1,2-beta-oligomannan phosphorylase
MILTNCRSKTFNRTVVSQSLLMSHPIIHRSSSNPLISPKDIIPSSPEMEVLGAFNPGATLFEGKRLMLIRVAERPIPEPGYISTAVLDQEGKLKILRIKRNDPDLISTDPRLFTYRGKNYVTSISHLRAAISENNGPFRASKTPTLFPSTRYEGYGIEDSRIVKIGNEYYINYTAASEYGIGTALAKTTDFKNFERLGLIFGPENKDIAIFPEKINGKYYAFHRPVTHYLGALSIWGASSPDLLAWGSHEIILSPRDGQWDSERVGAGAAPIKTKEGWLEIYHASDHHTYYRSGALLLDLEEPWKVIARSEKPLIEAEAPYEVSGFMPHVIFHNGLIDLGNGTIEIYYGAADERSCMATASIADILATLS